VGGGVYPPLNVYNGAEDTVVQCEVAGVARGDLDISITGDTLSIKGVKKGPADEEKLAYQRRERGTGEFSRTVVLSDPVDSSRVEAKLEKDARQIVEPGTVCFWTEGDAIALPYGRTPISTDERPKLASRCNVLGSIVGDPKRLAAVKAGEKVTVERSDGAKAG
jgi:hypothetical protein